MPTLIERYEALPKSLGGKPYQIDTIRLLADALREYIDPLVTGHCGDPGCDECDGQMDLRALLSRIEQEYGKS